MKEHELENLVLRWRRVRSERATLRSDVDGTVQDLRRRVLEIRTSNPEMHTTGETP